MKHLLLIVALCPTILFAQDKKGDDKPKPRPKDEELSITHHELTAGGEVISYTATAGYMPMKDEKDSVKARLFFVAYTRDGVADKGKRPVLFSFNGGPGSSSVWLHMGMLGPKIVAMTPDGEALKPPYSYTDNPNTWLSKSDLVFIDPMMTGFTRPMGATPQADYTGYDNDIRFVGDFIRLYLTRYKRWNSPKFLAGESYGTTRAAGLSSYLQETHGIYINGIALVSAVLNFATIRADRGNDLPFALQLPTFAATAWYHKKLDPRYTSLKTLLPEVEKFALGEYSAALMKGDLLTQREKEALAEKIHNYTGLSSEYILQNNLRLYVGRFNKELLRSTGTTIGRFDSRMKGVDYDEAGEDYEWDPSYDKTVRGPYTAAFNDHIRRNLKYESDLNYEILTGRVWPWKMPEGRYLHVADGLRSAMVKNPYLKVWVSNGYYDLATPYFATEYVIRHMFLPDAVKNNITLTYYEGGHMMYTHQPSLIQLKKDFDKWIGEAVGSE